MNVFEPRESLFGELIESTAPTERHAAIVNQLKDVLSQEEAISILAKYILAAHGWEHARRMVFDGLQTLAEDQERAVNKMADEAMTALELAERNVLQRVQMQVHASKRGKRAAEQRHSQPGGSREKRQKILAIWSSGKYSTKELCAEQEYDALRMSYSSARRALRGAPKPT